MIFYSQELDYTYFGNNGNETDDETYFCVSGVKNVNFWEYLAYVLNESPLAKLAMFCHLEF